MNYHNTPLKNFSQYNYVPNGRNTTIDALKGFAIILVVIGHICVNIPWLVKWIFSFHMPLFFMISGYLEKLKGFDKNETVREYAVKKAKSLLYPYIVFALLYSIATGVIAFRQHNMRLLIETLVMRLCGIRMESNVIGYIWFLLTLYEAQVIVFGLNKLNKEWIIIIGGVIGSLWEIFIPHFQLPFLFENTLLAMVFIYIGKLLAEYRKIFDNISKILVGLILVGLSFIQILTSILNARVNMYFFECGNMFLFWIASILGSCLCIILFEIIGKVYNWKVLHIIGKETLLIMALHFYVNAAILEVIRYFIDIDFIINDGILTLIWSMVLTLICYGLARIIKKYFAFIIIYPFHKK